MEYLITGGAGFIGSNIVRHLVQNKKSVRVLDKSGNRQDRQHQGRDEQRGFYRLRYSRRRDRQKSGQGSEIRASSGGSAVRADPSRFLKHRMM